MEDELEAVTFAHIEGNVLGPPRVRVRGRVRARVGVRVRVRLTTHHSEG